MPRKRRTPASRSATSIWIDVRRPLLLAHRGARRRAPENTFAAFDQALADGCDGFEFDVRRTADGRGITCHNARYQRLEIARHTYSDISERAAKRNPAQQLCCLEDVLRHYAGSAFLDIELKDRGLEHAVSAALRDCPPPRCLLSSFLPEVISIMHIHAPDVPLGLIADTRGALEQWRDLPVSCVVVHRALLSSRLVDDLHGTAKQVFAWTVNRQREMLHFAAWGVDGIISDDTELLRRTFPNI